MENNYNKYSVLASIYIKENPENFKLAMDSMLNQTIIPEQIVLVEDGPLTEELYAVIEEYKNKYPEIFTIVVSEINLGLGKALNLGLDSCRNELVARMDTDDYSKPERCEKQLETFNKDKALSIVGTCLDEFSDNIDNLLKSRIVPEKHEDIYKFGKKRSPFNHPTVMYKKSDVLSVGGYGDLRRCQDFDLWGRMLYKGFKAYNIQESLLLFRANEANSKRLSSKETRKCKNKVVKSFWKMGYASFIDYMVIATSQFILAIMPASFQKWVYNKFLRKRK